MLFVTRKEYCVLCKYGDARVIVATVGDPVNDVRPAWFRRHEGRVG